MDMHREVYGECKWHSSFDGHIVVAPSFGFARVRLCGGGGSVPPSLLALASHCFACSLFRLRNGRAVSGP